MIKVFIGYDPRQPVAFNVLAHSVWSRASKPVSIQRLQLNQLPITRRGLTEFTYSRFLVPYLCEYDGLGIFLDADVLCLGDICQLETDVLANKPAAVHVVQNERRFEWPSMMVFDCERCKTLTPEFVDDKANSLFDLAWAGGDAKVGALPSHWNHLVGYDPPRPDAKLIHFTMGIPCWQQTAVSEYADEWRKELKAANATVSFEALMGTSVHVQHLGKLKETANVA